LEAPAAGAKFVVGEFIHREQFERLAGVVDSLGAAFGREGR
jgi:hypothetical protein